MSDNKVHEHQYITKKDIILIIVSVLLAGFIGGYIGEIFAALRGLYGDTNYINFANKFLLSCLVFAHPVYIILYSFGHIIKLINKPENKLIVEDQKENSPLAEQSSDEHNQEINPKEIKSSVENNRENKQFTSNKSRIIIKWFKLISFVLSLSASIYVIIVFWKTDVGKIKDPSLSSTQTVIVIDDSKDQDLTEISEELISTPTNTITPTSTVTLTATPTPTPTITPSPTKGLESSCIRDDEWTVFPYDLITLQETPTPGCLSFPEFPLSSTPNGFHFTSPLGQRVGESGIYRNLPEKNFSIDFTIVINELTVSKEDSFSILYFGFIYPDQTNITRSVNMFRLLGNYNYKNCFLYFEDKPLFLDMWDELEESDEADKEKRPVNVNKYKVIVHIDVDENSNLNYVVINDGIPKADTIPYSNYYSEFLIAYNFAYPSIIDIYIENFMISY